MRPRYPIYIPSKGRHDPCHTARFFKREGLAFFLVVQPHEIPLYSKKFAPYLLPLPHDNFNLIQTRNWIKARSIEAGDIRHWQIDDNIMHVARLYRGKRIKCDAGPALQVVEDFVDRYENVALAGLQYEMFMVNGNPFPPFYLNGKVYSCSLILNEIPHKWRLIYNDDTDLCLQVLADGWCTILINAFMIKKIATMKVQGGNTTALYGGDGRLKMARSLERMWPHVVKVDRRWGRPQHVILDHWRKFNNPLKLKPGIDLATLHKNEYGLTLKQISPIQTPKIKEVYQAYHSLL